MTALGRAARAAATDLATTSSDQRNAALAAAAAALRSGSTAILVANEKDMAAAKEHGLGGSMLDRLFLDEGRIEAMAAGLETIIGLRDPVGRTLEEWERPNGFRFQGFRSQEKRAPLRTSPRSTECAHNLRITPFLWHLPL